MLAAIKEALIDFFSFDDGVMIEVGDESKAHSVVGVARSFPCLFHAKSCGFSLRSYGVNRGLDSRDEIGLVMSGACLSSRLERVEL